MDELTRINGDLNNLKARLTQENFEFQRQLQELDSSNGTLSKTKAQLQLQLDDTKARLDEETRVNALFIIFLIKCLFNPLNHKDILHLYFRNQQKCLPKTNTDTCSLIIIYNNGINLSKVGLIKIIVTYIIVTFKV